MCKCARGDADHSKELEAKGVTNGKTPAPTRPKGPPPLSAQPKKSAMKKPPAPAPAPRVSSKEEIADAADEPYIPSPDLPGDQYFERELSDFNNKDGTMGIKISGVEVVSISKGREEKFVRAWRWAFKFVRAWRWSASRKVGRNVGFPICWKSFPLAFHPFECGKSLQWLSFECGKSLVGGENRVFLVLDLEFRTVFVYCSTENPVQLSKSGGWGERIGLELDDEVNAVNGIKLFPLSMEKRLELLKGKKPMIVKFKRPAVKDGYFNVLMNAEKLGAR